MASGNRSGVTRENRKEEDLACHLSTQQANVPENPEAQLG